MTDTPFIVGQTYRTRGGGTARVICVDAKGDHNPIVALHSHEDGSESLWKHTASGLVHSVNNRYDLLPPKPVRVRRWFIANSPIGWSQRENTKDMIEVILTIPHDIAAQCDWLKDAEIVHDD